MAEGDAILLAVEEIALHLETAPLDEYLLIPGLGGICTKWFRPFPADGAGLAWKVRAARMIYEKWSGKI